MQPLDTDIYAIAAHPSWRQSRMNRPLMLAAQAVAQVQVQDFYCSFPNYSIDVAAGQVAL